MLRYVMFYVSIHSLTSVLLYNIPIQSHSMGLDWTGTDIHGMGWYGAEKSVSQTCE